MKRNPADLRSLLVAFSIFSSVMAATPAASETVSDFGANGVAGVDGGPGQDGGNGTDGGSATASSGPDDSSNRSTAEGGRGGGGGDGGDPDGSGGNGGDGGDALAESSSIQTTGYTSTDARATGGSAGSAGAAAPAGTGSGGTPGEAGDAEAIASVSNTGGNGNATAVATGGAGGGVRGAGLRGSDGGSATAIAVVDVSGSGTARAEARGGAGGGGLLGADAGDGAAVVLDDDSTVVGTTALDATIRETQTAYGGRGGLSAGGVAGDGGDATTHNTSLGQSGVLLRFESRSEGGQGGDANLGGSAGAGGLATSGIEASFDGDVSISAQSIGGDGGSVSRGPGTGGVGGDATATALATSLAEGGSASAAAYAVGGDGGGAYGMRGRDGASGGEVSVRAVATASGTATAAGRSVGGAGGAGSFGGDGGDGGGATLENAVSAVGGIISLSQEARGGDGGDSGFGETMDVRAAGRGGDASSILETTNPLGDVEMNVDARGGSGGGGSGAFVSAGEAGNAHASAVGTAAGDVDIFATATAGVAGDLSVLQTAGVDGSEATLGPVRGVSTAGGRVEVFGVVRAGAGSGSQTLAGAGADAVLVDAVEGETTGTLILHQSAFAGDAGNANASGFGAPPDVGARGGEAMSGLERAIDAASLTLDVESFGGDSSGTDVLGAAIAGGDATSRVGGLNRAGELVLQYRAEGGTGAKPGGDGTTGGRGGSARSIVEAATEGDGHAIRVVPSGTSSVSTIGGIGGSNTFGAGRSGGDGGSAMTEVDALAAGDSEIDVHATALGGAGGAGSSGARGGDGGIAEAHARGENAGASSVEVLAEATGGHGGFGPVTGGGLGGGTGGQASATAYGGSTGGGDVTATARVIGGGGSGVGVSAGAELRDAVSGQTTGRLRLVQEAIGGDRSQGGAGDATSSLSWIDDDGGALELESVATGGGGETPGVAHADAYGEGLDAVQAVARARGGNGSGAAGAGGSASVGPVAGHSSRGGLVRVEAEVVGGDGSTTDNFARTPGGGSGADASLDNAVEGSTSGILQLVQRAIGGSAGEVGEGASGGGAAGFATNRLVRAVSVGALEADVESRAGQGSNERIDLAGATAGGAALVETDLTNDAGSVSIVGSAIGGEAGRGLFGRVSGAGGDAVLRASATTTLSGQDVRIGGDRFQAFGARAGDSFRGSGGRGTPPGVAGRGGNAESRSLGTALGDSVVTVFDKAWGGDGLDGGNAVSEAHGENHGVQSVTVLSEANAGRAFDSPGKGGDAYASAIGVSRGGLMDVQAIARAGRRGGTLSNPLSASSNTIAETRAEASGGTGLVMANASGSTTGEIGTSGFRTDATAMAAVHSTTSVEAIVGRSARAALASTRNVAVHVEGLTAREDEFGRIGMNIVLDECRPVDSPFATAELSPNSFDLLAGRENLDGIFLSFLELRLDDEGFEETVFRVENGTQLVLERVLSTAEDARLFFTSIIDLGDYDDELYFMGVDLHFTMEAGAAGSNIGTYFAVGTVPVPEPGTGLLVSLGLALLAMRRGRRR